MGGRRWGSGHTRRGREGRGGGVTKPWGTRRGGGGRLRRKARWCQRRGHCRQRRRIWRRRAGRCRRGHGRQQPASVAGALLLLVRGGFRVFGEPCGVERRRHQTPKNFQCRRRRRLCVWRCFGFTAASCRLGVVGVRGGPVRGPWHSAANHEPQNEKDVHESRHFFVAALTWRGWLLLLFPHARSMQRATIRGRSWFVEL